MHSTRWTFSTYLGWYSDHNPRKKQAQVTVLLEPDRQ